MDKTNASTANDSPQRKSRIGEIAGGLIVIGIGLVFLADNLDIAVPFFGWHRWWALFILFGAAAPAGRAIDRFRETGGVDAQVMHSLISALAVVAVATIFMLDASFAMWWPVFVILGGLSMLLSSDRRRQRH
jgi:hypothetical protein